MTLTLRPQPLITAADFQQRGCLVEGLAPSSRGEGDRHLWFRFPKDLPAPSDDDCDAYVLALLLDAMRCGHDQMDVQGSVSLELLRNLEELQLAWHKWYPDLYRLVDIRCERVRSGDSLTEGAVCAFSGGVDATFSVWRHSQRLAGYGSRDIRMCVIVHGFDIPLSQPDVFERAANRSAATLADINIPLVRVSTNYRDISDVNWEHACGSALAGALSNFREFAGTGIIGSSEPYDSLVIPWGSSPITDHLLSSDGFRVIHDGAGFNRTEKVAVIEGWREGVNNLRVCWQGEALDRNCGRCEKCLRTRLNFLATGQPQPKCFPDTDLLQDMKRVRLKNDIARSEWRQIYRYATEHGVRAPWVSRIPAVIRRKRLKDYLKPTQ